MMFFYTYVLRSLYDGDHYVGYTNNLRRRLEEHNSGKVKSSSPYRPYKIIYTESFITLREARQREKFYKSTTGRRKLHEIIG